MTSVLKHKLFSVKNLLSSPVVTPGAMVTVKGSSGLVGSFRKIKMEINDYLL